MARRARLIIRTRNFDRVESALQQIPTDYRRRYMPRALKTAGRDIVRQARPNVPVKTGALRDSLHEEVNNLNLIITGSRKTNEYLIFQERGTRYIRAKHFIRNAYRKVWRNFGTILKRSVR